jgi:curved DNA-binding protein CbpA
VENGRLVNYYDFLMISPNADLKMLEAAVRVMLARYNPKNPETGDEHSFELVKRAYLTLSDPHHRATYDKQLTEQGQNGLRDVSDSVTLDLVQSEEKKRQGVIALLYRRMMVNCHDPGVSTPQIEDTLGLEHEDMQFAYWVLREQGLITRTENGNFSISVEGVLWAENGGLPQLAETLNAAEFSPRPVQKAETAAPETPRNRPIAAAAGRA